MAENIAISILERIGHVVIQRNYYTKWGELDVITLHNGVIHIFEVKSTFFNTNPAENFSKKKLNRVMRSVRLYCYAHKIREEDIQIDLLLIFVSKRSFEIIENANLYFH